ncbi:MAG: GAF domain-containing protein [Armatimonadetes bacterium]|nr:GAF domain-containing protein [Armatimonadota bacterium]
MPNTSVLKQLSAIAATEWDTDTALRMLAESAMELTDSTTAMIGRMNEELGTLELSIIAGKHAEESEVRQVEITAEEGAGIVAYVAAKGESFVTGNVTKEPQYMNLIRTSKSEIAVPIMDRHGRVRAVLNLESDEENHYSDDHLEIAETIAFLVLTVVTREELLRREEALELIGSALDRATTEEDLIENVLGIAGDVLRFQSCSLFLLDPLTDLFMLRGSAGSLKDRVGGVGYKANEGCTGWVCANGLPLRLENPQEDERWRGLWLDLPKEKVASYLAVPIVYRGKSIGALRVVRRVGENPYRDSQFTEDDERLLSTVAEQTAMGLENVRSVQRAIQIERMAAWGELSAKSSHMIGNRVFALKGDVNELGHLLREEGKDFAELLALQKSLDTNVHRIEEILQEFRDFVMATQLSTVRADLNFVVKEAVEEVFPRRSEIHLVYDLGEIPEVEIDARKIRRAITEIVENGLSFFSTGQLKVSTYIANRELKRRASLPLKREFAAVEVLDQGPGVSAEQKNQIFQPFYSSRVKGMGLGLSIVKGIVEAHGGSVVETGELGNGAKFIILLPLAGK